MKDSIEERYFEWLYSQIAAVKNRNPARSYWKLAKQMHGYPFTWFVPNDDNRAEDGRELREEFMVESFIDSVDDLWMDLDCSIFEMLIGLSRRVAFESYGSSGEWFRELITNLGLVELTDRGYNSINARDVDRTLERLVNRTYDRKGHGGGLFPLLRAMEDQREVEIWYQMSAYLLAKERMADHL